MKLWYFMVSFSSFIVTFKINSKRRLIIFQTMFKWIFGTSLYILIIFTNYWYYLKFKWINTLKYLGHRNSGMNENICLKIISLCPIYASDFDKLNYIVKYILYLNNVFYNKNCTFYTLLSHKCNFFLYKWCNFLLFDAASRPLSSLRFLLLWMALFFPQTRYFFELE